MISERQLADGFASLWQEYFPLLTPLFIRHFNAGQKERVVTAAGQLVLPVPMSAEVEEFDFSTELGFELARENYKIRGGGRSNPLDAIERARIRIALLRRDFEFRDPLV